MNVDRCVCHRQKFVHLKQVAERVGATSIAELQCHVEFGKTCKLCHPYVRRMLAAGDAGATAFSAFDER